MRSLLGLGLLLLSFLGFGSASLLGGHAKPCHHCTTTTVTTATTTVPATTTTPTTTSSGGPPVFADEFNGPAGSKPDPTVWTAEKRTATTGGTLFDGWNQISEDGNGDLVITAYKNTSGQWVSGSMYRTATYSGPRHVEVRAETAAGYGTQNAPVWETHKGGATFECDVVESLGREPQTYHTTLHNWTVSPQVGSGKSIATSSVLADGFHVYAADVYADHVDFSFDGSLVSTVFASAVGLTDLTQYAVNPVVSLNMGGSWAGTPTISGPVSMLVDYVRVTSLP